MSPSKKRTTGLSLLFLTFTLLARFLVRTGGVGAEPSPQPMPRPTRAPRAFLSADEAQSIVENAADDLEDPAWDDGVGWRRINAYRAVSTPVQPAGLSIGGHISTNHGTPAVNVAVTVSHTGVLSTTYTNALGLYLQTGLISGTYVVTPYQENASFIPISRTISIGPGSATGINFTRKDFRVYLPLVHREYESAVLLPNDSFFGSQWGLHNTGQSGGTEDADIDAPQAWYHHTGDSSVIIAVVDTGVDMDHPEFSGRFAAGWDFVNGDSDPDDDHGHGTHVAGIAAAAGNNGQGVAGVAWNVRIMPIKVLDGGGMGSYSDMINGINFAVNNGARVINMSLGGLSPSQALQDAVDYAYNNDVLLIAAAGNCGGSDYGANGCDYQDQPHYPAANDNVLAVASTTPWDSQSSSSNQGDYIDIAAPGSNILSTYLGGGYTYRSGTSMATPFVAGLAGLVYSKFPSYTLHQVTQAIVHNADDLGTSGRDDLFGCGRINAHHSLLSGALSSGCAGWSGLSAESTPPQAIRPTYAQFHPGLLLVKFRGTTTLAECKTILSTHGLTVSSKVQELDLYLVAVPEGQELTLVEALNALPAVAYAEPDYRIYALAD